MIKNFRLTPNEEIEVTGLDGKHAHIKNYSDVSVYVSETPGITPDSDGVLDIPGSSCGTIYHFNGTIYLLGETSNKVCVYSCDSELKPF